jgi:hypothetical protein
MGTGTGSVLLRSLVIAVLALGAIGCSDDPEKPGTIPTPRPTESSTASTPTPTPVEAQVEAAMTAYLAAANDALVSGNTSRMEALSDPRCPCRALARKLRRVYGSGGRYEGAEYSIRTLKVHDIHGRAALAEVRADIAPYKVLNGSDKVTEDSKGGQLHTDFSLLVKEGSWIVANSFDLG